MKPTISIIIPEIQNESNLIRCLNGIHRQTFWDYEIILADDVCEEEVANRYGLRKLKKKQDNYWQNLDDALSLAEGRFLFFCDESFVLSPQLLQSLLEESQEEGILVEGQCVKCTRKGMADASDWQISVFGKLFQKELAKKAGLPFDGKGGCELLFVTKYASLCPGGRRIAETFFYTEENYASHCLGEIEVEAAEKIIQNCKQASLESQWGKSICDRLLFQGENQGIDEERLQSLQRATVIAQMYREDKKMGCYIAEQYVSTEYRICKMQRDEERYALLQRYFSLYREEQEFLPLLLPIFGMERERFCRILDCPLEEYLLYDEKLPYQQETSRVMELRLEELEKRLRTLEEQKPLTVKLHSEEADVIDRRPEHNMPEGPELAEFVIEKYRQGSLGLKTIVKSFSGWLKYKM